MINPVVLYATGGALVAGALGGWTIRDWKADSDQLAAVERAHEAEKRAIVAANESSAGYEQVLADLRPREIETRNTIREVYRNVEVPANCAVPTTGVGLLDDARVRANAATTGEPSSEVQRTAEASGTDD